MRAKNLSNRTMPSAVKVTSYCMRKPMNRVFFLLVAIAILSASGCHRKAPVGATTRIQMGQTNAPGSAADVMSHTAARFGVPLYPNSSADTAHFSMADNVSQTNPRAYLMYMTPDTVDQVVEFYRTKLTMDVSDFQGAKQLKGFAPTGAQVTINVGRDNSSNVTRFVIMAFLPATGARTFNTVATTAPAVAAPTPAPQSAASQTYTPDQSADQNTWTYSTSNDPNSQTETGEATAPSNAPEQSGEGEAEPGPNDPNNAPTSEPPNDSNQDSGPPGDGG